MSSQVKDKPKLLVIAGAGSSIPFGMPSVNKIDDLMKDWAKKWTRETGESSDLDVFNTIFRACERYYDRSDNIYGWRPTYERVLSAMTEFSTWMLPPPFGHPISGPLMVKATTDLARPGPLAWLHESSGDERVAQLRGFNLEQLGSMQVALAKHLRRQCLELDKDLPLLGQLNSFLGELQEWFDLGIYNLNYDSIIRTTWRESWTGFDNSGEFNAAHVLQRANWGFQYQLHGSVHHSIVGEHARPRIVWLENLQGQFIDFAPGPTDMSEGFKWTPVTTLVAGGHKLEHLLSDPFHTLHSAFVRHAHEADAFLIAGYGFGDMHVNRALRNTFQKYVGMPKSAPRVVVLEKSRPNRPESQRLASHDFWVFEMTHAFKTTFSDGSGFPSDSNRTVARCIEQRKFEEDANRRVAIWHGGFEEAISCPGTIEEIVCRLLNRSQ